MLRCWDFDGSVDDCQRVTCEDRIGTGPPQARTEVIYVDLGYCVTCVSLLGTISHLRKTIMMSGLDGSGAVHTVLPWEAFGGHVPSGGSEIYWFDQSTPIHLF